MRIGHGFDIHRLVSGRPLILGGVEIPSDLGLEGHSDADVLLHALCDALLGALGKGDIGSYFPDTDPKWKGARSALFVEKAAALVKEAGCKISNLDAVLMAEVPRIGPHRTKITGAMAKLLDLDASKLNLKAKTMEGLGAVGGGEAITCEAVVTLKGGACG